MAVEGKAVKPLPGWVRVMRIVFLVGAGLFLVGILTQAFLAGQGIFQVASFDAHVALGWPLAHVLGPLVLIISFLTRVGWRLHVLAALGFVLAAVVPIFAAMRSDAPDVAAIHPLSAMLTFGLLLYVWWEVLPLVRQPTVTPRVVGKPAPAGRPATQK